ncbi:MAG: hypothetical protein GY759_20515 [Chloroflexi bacterium]|nr:hypothetical protein [Chloroflexota bacterium]
MAKISRKKRKQQRQPNVPQYEVPVESAPPVESASEDKEDADSTTAVVAPEAAVVTVAAASITGRSTIDTVDWKSEYPFVMGDLRRLFIVSILMLALLLVLNYFLV